MTKSCVTYALAASLSVGAAGCGEALVSNETYETPLISLAPYFTEPYDASSLVGKRIGVVWVDPLQLRDDLPQPAASIEERLVDKQFTVDIYAPPPAAAIRRLADPKTGAFAFSYAFGELVVYDDGDGDGRFAIAPRAQGSGMIPPDAYAGSVENRLLIYVETPARPGASFDDLWDVLRSAPGYHLASVSCSPSTQVVPVDGSNDFVMSLSPEPSPHIIVTRTCLGTVPAQPVQAPP